jgi:uncharacterized protein
LEESQKKSLNIAVVGTGAAGLTAAYLLQERHLVTLYEKSRHIGGHVQTFPVPHGPDKALPLEMGFALLNDGAYPVFRRLLDRLEVPLRDVPRPSFGYYHEGSGFQYAQTGWNGLFAQRKNLWNPSYWSLLGGKARFASGAPGDLRSGKLAGRTLGDYLEDGNFTKDFLWDFLFPLGSALWSVPAKDMEGFPADLFVESLAAKGWLGPPAPPHGKSVEGGSGRYVKAILRRLKTRVRTGEAVEEVRRQKSGVLLGIKGGGQSAYDKVVLACHADEALGLLSDPDAQEQRLLSHWVYRKNWVQLHTDADVMPPLKRARASFNYVREKETTPSEPVSLTCHLNRILGLAAREDYFLTFNRIRPIPQRHVLKEAYFTHPVFTPEAVAAQRELKSLNGARHTYYCGSYLGSGFHEDAVQSGVEVARFFGLEL